MKALLNWLSSVWKRICDTWRLFDEGFDYSEADYLSERISRLEKEVEMLKAKSPSVASLDSP